MLDGLIAENTPVHCLLSEYSRDETQLPTKSRCWIARSGSRVVESGHGDGITIPSRLSSTIARISVATRVSRERY